MQPKDQRLWYAAASQVQMSNSRWQIALPFRGSAQLHLGVPLRQRFLVDCVKKTVAN